MYGKGVSERRVGELIRGQDIVVATKFPSGNFSRERSLPATLDESLTRLQRTRIDLYQIHYPFPWLSIRKLMNLMADAVEAGKIRTVGVSNYNAKQMRTASHRAGQARTAARVEPGPILALAPCSGDQRSARRVPSWASP